LLKLSISFLKFDHDSKYENIDEKKTGCPNEQPASLLF